MAAAHCSTSLALLGGIVVLFVEGGFAMAAMSTGVAEPFRDLPHYFWEIVSMAPFCGGFFIVPFVAIGIFAMAASRVGRFSRLAQAQMRVLMLGHLPLFVPCIVWSIAGALAEAGHPTFSLLRSPKPAWVFSPIVAFLGHPVWLFFLLGLPVVLWILAMRRLRELVRRLEERAMPRCAACDYLLIGLREARCPECGRSFDPSLLNAGSDVAGPPIST